MASTKRSLAFRGARIAAPLALLVVILAVRPGAATVATQPVKVRLREAPAAVAPGRAVTLEFEFLAAEAGAEPEVGDVRLSGAGWAVLPDEGPPRFALRPGVPASRKFEAVAPGVRAPLTLHWSANGVAHERELDLDRAVRLAHPLRARQVSETWRSAPVPAGALMRRPEPAPASEATARDPADRVERTPSEPLAAAARTIRVHGRFMYRRPDRPSDLIGADGMTVHVRDEDPWNSDDELATTVTAIDGTFDVSFQWSQDEGNPELFVEFEASNSWATVEDSWFERNYRWRTGTWDGYAGSDLDVMTWAPSDDGSEAAPHILNTIVRAARWCLDDESYFPGSIDVQWPGTGLSSYYDFTWHEIHLKEEDSWSEHAAAHEYGHHIHYDVASPPFPNYCNGHCEGLCVSPAGKHCLWCSEMGDIHFTEGFPGWFGWVQTSSYPSRYGLAAYDPVDFEWIGMCTDVSPSGYHDPLRTEGFVAALLEDITDSPNEQDPWRGGALPDAMALGPHSVFEVVRSDAPTTVLGFLDAFRARYASTAGSLCSTAANDGYDLDTQAPGSPVNLASTSHVVNVESPVARLVMTWTAPADDWAGASGYSVAVTANAPAAPDQVAELGNVTNWTSTPHEAGTWYVTLRAVDAVGHWSPSYATAGPYVIRDPVPVDFAPVTPAGWTRPLVLRNQPTGVTETSGLFTTRLSGDRDSTWFSYAGVNHGEVTTYGIQHHAKVYLDGVEVVGRRFDGAAAGYTLYVMNQGWLNVRGGRHSLGVRWDASDKFSEPNEQDNVHGRQYVFEPLTLAAGVPVTRSAPPAKTAGADLLTEGLQMSNADGLRMGSGTGWNAVAIRPLADTDDYECRLHFASSAVDTGFGAPRATSARAPGLLDAVIVNRHTLPGSSWDVGVLNTSGGTGSYQAEYATSTTLTWNVPEVITLLPGRTIALRDLYVGAGQVGMVAVWPKIVKGAGAVHAQWRSRTFTQGGLMDNASNLDLPSACCPALVINASAAGWYGVLFYRDPGDGLDTLVVSVTAGPVPLDIRPVASPGWYAALVPRPLADAQQASVPAPDTLVGEQPSTYVSASMLAGAFTSTGPVAGEVRVDGAPVLSPYWASTTAGFYNTLLSMGPVTVPGGRHTLSARYDPANQYTELLETNNAGGGQWVWSPSEILLAIPAQRPAPPGPFDGWDDLAADSTLRFDCDGVRTPLFSPSGDHAWWAAVFAMPGASSALDLRLHPTCRGARAGFDTALAVSRSGIARCELVVANLRLTPLRQFDVGAVRQGEASEPYTIEALRSGSGAAYLDGEAGPFTVPAGHLARLHEFRMTAGPHVIRLENESGLVDWGLSVHRGDIAFQSRSSVGDSSASWLSPPGYSEQVQVDMPGDGYCAVAVWKAVRGDLAAEGSYRLRAWSGVLSAGDAPPARSRLANAAPNPSAGPASCAFDLARSGRVDLAVFDLRGARIRTLERGPLAPGRHVRVWDGRDEGGRETPPGLYIVRFECEEASEARKLVRVR